VRLNRTRLRLLSSALALCACGAPEAGSSARSFAIEGGAVARACDFPAVVQVEERCSGAFITPGLIAYAGHCGLNVHHVQRIGSDGTVQTLTVSSCFGPYGTSSTDLAFCKVEAPQANLTIATILPECQASSLAVGLDVTVVGMGLDGPDGSPGVKKFMSARIESYSDSEIVLSVSNGVTCSGDSGGPIYAQIGGVWNLIGIINRGDQPTCDKQFVYGVPLLPWVTWVEQTAAVRASPCYLHGAWTPTSTCALAVVDSAQECRASLPTLPKVGPCGNAAEPAPLDPSLVSVTDQPKDGARLALDGAPFVVGLDATPSDAEFLVDLELKGPSGLVWLRHYELPPYHRELPSNEAPGHWSALARLTIGGKHYVREWSFDTTATADARRAPGCALETTARSGSLPLAWLWACACVVIRRRRRYR